MFFFSEKIKEAANNQNIFSLFEIQNVKSNGLNGILNIEIQSDQNVTIKTEKYLGIC